MSQTIQTMLISLLTSLLVSLFTFILGLKSGKNQADRMKVRQIYQSIYTQMVVLKRALEDNRPKKWSDYEKENIGFGSYRFIAPIQKMDQEGELLLIKSSIAVTAKTLEEELIKYGSQTYYLIESLHNSLTNAQHLYKEGSEFKQYNTSNNNAHFESSNPRNCKSYTQGDYRDFYDKKAIKKIFNRLTSSPPCAIEFRLQNTSKTLTCKIYPDSLTCSIPEFIDQVYSIFNSEIDEFNELLSLKNDLLSEIDELLPKVAKKAKEPFSFWGTLFGAFGDMFK